jgi:hypothetical protein
MLILDELVNATITSMRLGWKLNIGLVCGNQREASTLLYDNWRRYTVTNNTL